MHTRILQRYACMYVCMRAYIHEYIHAYIRTYMYRPSVKGHACPHTCIHAYMHSYIHVHLTFNFTSLVICIHIHTMHTCMHTCTTTDLLFHLTRHFDGPAATHTHIHARQYGSVCMPLCECMHVSVRVCVFVWYAVVICASRYKRWCNICTHVHGVFCMHACDEAG
jgi:hypothetical protein